MGPLGLIVTAGDHTKKGKCENNYGGDIKPQPVFGPKQKADSKYFLLGMAMGRGPISPYLSLIFCVYFYPLFILVKFI